LFGVRNRIIADQGRCNGCKAQVEKNVLATAVYDKERFDKNRAKVLRHKVGDFVLLKSEERHQTKLRPKFKGPFELIQVLEVDDVDLSNVRAQVEKNVIATEVYDKERFDKNKAKVLRHKVGDFVLFKREERPKFKGPFELIQVLEGDRYTLKSLTNKRNYKNAHEDLRKIPEEFLRIRKPEDQFCGFKSKS